MGNQFKRSELLFKKEGMEKLKKANILIFGIGGVGGYVVEALARSGIYHFTLVDNDIVDETNINRQIIATYDSLGQPKVEIMKKRILSINPEAVIDIRQCFYLPETANEFDFSKYDYVVDCVDTVAAKISIIVEAKKNNIPVISAMGAGNKMHPEMLEISDISKTEVDPLAKVIRTSLRKLGINHLKVVYSKEKPIDLENNQEIEMKKSGRPASASNAFVPSTMGLIIAGEIIRELIGYDK